MWCGEMEGRGGTQGEERREEKLFKNEKNRPLLNILLIKT